MLCCPVCRGTFVYEIAGGYLGQVYRCKDCGYRGSFVLLVDEPCMMTGSRTKEDDEEVR